MTAASFNLDRTNLFSAASAEFWLVALCCQWPLSSDSSRRLDSLLAAPLDWARVERLSTRHRVQGLVHAALRERQCVPLATREWLSAEASVIARSNLAAVPVIARITRALEQENLPFLLLKGLPLGRLAYSDLGLRHSKDIDLLIAQTHVATAERLLFRMNFRRTDLATALTPGQSGLYQRYRQHYEFVQSGSGIRLELHWRAFANAQMNETFPADPQWVDLGGGLRVPCLPADELLLNLCVHGAGHAWFRLKWIADIAALLAQAPAGAASDLLATARARDLDRPVEQALLLCDSLFPTASNSVSQPSMAGRWLAHLAVAALLEESTDAPTAQTDFVPRGLKRSRFLLRRSWHYRLEEARMRVTSPIDWQTCELPPSLQFLYPLLRLPFWIRRRWFPQARTRPSS